MIYVGARSPKKLSKAYAGSLQQVRYGKVHRISTTEHTVHTINHKKTTTPTIPDLLIAIGGEQIFF